MLKALFFALLALPLSAGAQSSCSFILFKIPNYDTVPNRIDKNGNVVGTAFGFSSPNTGFLRSVKGKITQYSVPNATATNLSDRNSSGEVVGTYQDTNFVTHGFTLYQGTFTQVDYPSAAQTALNSINDAQTIVGDYLDSAGNFHGFELSGGVFTDITYPGATSTIPEGINNLGEITGAYTVSSSPNDNGFVLLNGVYKKVDDPSGANGTFLEGLNDSGEVAGDSYISFSVPTQGFVYRNGKFTNVAVPNASFDTANGVNANGLITGAASFSDGYHGYIARCQ
jgi:hypothetical protein